MGVPDREVVWDSGGNKLFLHLTELFVDDNKCKYGSRIFWDWDISFEKHSEYRNALALGALFWSGFYFYGRTAVRSAM